MSGERIDPYVNRPTKMATRCLLLIEEEGLTNSSRSLRGRGRKGEEGGGKGREGEGGGGRGRKGEGRGERGREGEEGGGRGREGEGRGREGERGGRGEGRGRRGGMKIWRETGMWQRGGDKHTKKKKEDKKKRWKER